MLKKTKQVKQKQQHNAGCNIKYIGTKKSLLKKLDGGF